MTDDALVAKRLAFIETCLRELREQGRPELIASDVRERRFVEHTLQLAIQAMLDVASHVVSERRLGEPRTNRELLDLLERDGWLAGELAARLRDAAGLRNVLVHGYAEVDLGVVRDVLTHRLGDLDEFIAAVRTRIASEP
jgi:uncharacterized protein YutE (UPF0331/DUF86 family)